MKGRKRHLLVDTQGFVLKALVHAADIADRDGGRLLLEAFEPDRAGFPRLRHRWVDAGYRGEVRVVLVNTDRSEGFVVEPGMRIAQLVIVPVTLAVPVEVEELPETERGVAGFGSSGT